MRLFYAFRLDGLLDYNWIITCKCPRHLWRAWRQDCPWGCGRSSGDEDAYSAPIQYGKTWFLCSFRDIDFDCRAEAKLKRWWFCSQVLLRIGTIYAIVFRLLGGLSSKLLRWCLNMQIYSFTSNTCRTFMIIPNTSSINSNINYQTELNTPNPRVI